MLLYKIYFKVSLSSPLPSLCPLSPTVPKFSVPSLSRPVKVAAALKKTKTEQKTPLLPPCGYLLISRHASQSR